LATQALRVDQLIMVLQERLVHRDRKEVLDMPVQLVQLVQQATQATPVPMLNTALVQVVERFEYRGIYYMYCDMFVQQILQPLHIT